jgi:hypothetical protein
MAVKSGLGHRSREASRGDLGAALHPRDRSGITFTFTSVPRWEGRYGLRATLSVRSSAELRLSGLRSGSLRGARLGVGVGGVPGGGASFIYRWGENLVAFGRRRRARSFRFG